MAHLRRGRILNVYAEQSTSLIWLCANGKSHAYSWGFTSHHHFMNYELNFTADWWEEFIIKIYIRDMVWLSFSRDGNLKNYACILRYSLLIDEFSRRHSSLKIFIVLNYASKYNLHAEYCGHFFYRIFNHHGLWTPGKIGIFKIIDTKFMKIWNFREQELSLNKKSDSN